jgi:hypothetical protein
LQVTSFDRKRQTLAFINTTLLVRCSSPESGIKSDIVDFIASGP